MNVELKVYNSLSRKKEIFKPLSAPYVGMYVCGPTVYGEAHLGHARSAITFDVIFRFLSHQQYKVRYVRNITDVGHLEHDADDGEDKIAKKAKLEKLEPMEVVKRYTSYYQTALRKLNVQEPSIEPVASGHIPEQIKLTQQIIDAGMAYESHGSVYFDVLKYNETNRYGELSGRVVDELMSGTRTLDGQDEKRSPLDFALWKNASPEHIMKWNSPWGMGFPGWHIECTAMSNKYLGAQFDIHGGGLDLMFPHHECEIAQSIAGLRSQPAKYWLHNNMITINGQKMGKSLGNFITLDQLFSGDHPMLAKAYSPMTIRFFILQAHYRSTLDFSNEALVAAGKGYKKLMNGLRILRKMEYAPTDTIVIDDKQEQELIKLSEACYAGLSDDFNTAVTIASLFNVVKKAHTLQLNHTLFNCISKESFDKMKHTFIVLTNAVLGLLEEEPNNNEVMIEGLLEWYKQAKENKNYEQVDRIRAWFKACGMQIKDMKNTIDWAYEEA
ncbi:MAG TPA: cysteine--tRNA ligase [Cytophagaceae bacterium]|jgi:cysteinyl-tRNA synthetase|nr:cysteine--tRNA ligase [Cytophagaceae bacterium]